MDSLSPKQDILALTTRIVAAYVAKNAVPAANVAALIESTHKALAGLSVPGEQAAGGPKPAVPVKKSVFPDFIICMEDGKRLKMMKRHLAKTYGMTPEQYRNKWRLPSEYPMVAPNYAERRSTLAKQFGLGRTRPAPPAPEEVEVATAKRRGRTAKQAA